LRATADAIVVGARTARVDDPELACRRRGAAQPLRVIVDSRGGLPLDRRVLREGAERTVIATTTACPARRREACARTGAAVWVLPAAGGHVSMPALLKRMGAEGWLHVLCEGGGELAAALIRARAVDRYVLFVAPTLLGAGGRPAIGGAGWPLATAPRLRWTTCRPCGGDVMLEGAPVRAKE
jgi:diaminohydroxyphosphoribosylaminopyrimidine deaminase/5-amino-6-(5-phosphoribosylamino)uracil reductase